MSLNQPLLLSSALVHQVLLSPTTYPYKQVASRGECVACRCPDGNIRFQRIILFGAECLHRVHPCRARRGHS